MSKYISAFDKIHVTADMEKRIAENLEKESRRVAEMPQRGRMPQRGKMLQRGLNAFLQQNRLVYAIAACCLLVFSAAILYSSLTKQAGPDPVAGVVSPFKVFASIDELKNALPFELIVPAKIPPQYKIEGIDSIGGKTAQIRYSDGNTTITFRAAAGKEDISGDTSIYDSIQSKTVSGMEVTLKGNGDLVYLAIWSDDTCSYSLSILQGMSEELVLEIIQSLHQ